MKNITKFQINLLEYDFIYLLYSLNPVIDMYRENKSITSIPFKIWYITNKNSLGLH